MASVAQVMPHVGEAEQALAAFMFIVNGAGLFWDLENHARRGAEFKLKNELASFKRYVDTLDRICVAYPQTTLEKRKAPTALVSAYRGMIKLLEEGTPTSEVQFFVTANQVRSTAPRWYLEALIYDMTHRPAKASDPNRHYLVLNSRGELDNPENAFVL